LYNFKNTRVYNQNNSNNNKKYQKTNYHNNNESNTSDNSNSNNNSISKKINNTQQSVSNTIIKQESNYEDVYKKIIEILCLENTNDNEKVKIIMENFDRDSNAENILKSILVAMKDESISIIEGLNILDKIGFNNESYFIEHLTNVVDDTNGICLSDYNGSKNERILSCTLLGELYKIATESDQFTFLRELPNFCCTVVEKWLDFENKSLTYTTRIRNINNLKYFLISCHDEFKKTDITTMRNIYCLVENYLLDQNKCEEYQPEFTSFLTVLCRKTYGLSCSKEDYQ
jgi:hypothetical protein